MIQDALLEFSSAQAFTANATGTNVVDLSEARDIGEGEGLFVEFDCNTAVAGTAATVQFQLVAADDATLTTNATVLDETQAIAQATLVNGYRTALRIPPQIGSLGHRYFGVKYVVGGTMTGGAFSAYVVKDLEDPLKFYAVGYQVI